MPPEPSVFFIVFDSLGSKLLYDWNMEVEAEMVKESGPRLNIKTVLSTYGDFHVKDKTAVRTSYL